MGTMHHHAIVVTTFDEEMIRKCHNIASGLNPYVTEIFETATNGYFSFAVLPDGSKEEWAESDVGDRARAALLEWIDKQAYDDGSNALQYAEVSYGELEPTLKTNTRREE